MSYLADTNILLRFISPSDPNHVLVRSVISSLLKQGERVCYTPQNLVEFWNVCTRPTTSRGGFGLTTDDFKRFSEINVVHPSALSIAWGKWSRVFRKSLTLFPFTYPPTTARGNHCTLVLKKVLKTPLLCRTKALIHLHPRWIGLLDSTGKLALKASL